MADNYQISVGVKADFSDLTTQQQQAAEVVTSTNEEMAASYQSVGVAPAEAGAASEAAIPEHLAASAAMHTLEGNFVGNTRAADRFLASTLGLGPALQAAFPIFGAVAFGSIIVEIGEKLVEAFDIGGKHARKLEEDIRSLDDKFLETNDSLNVEIDKIEMANAKLEHKPFNGMKLAIDEAYLSADRLQQKLDSIIKSELGAIKEMQPSTTKQVVEFLSGAHTEGGTNYEQTMLREHTRHLDDARTEQDKLNESTSYYASLQTRLKQLTQWQASPLRLVDYKHEIDATKQLIEWQKQEQEAIKGTIEVDKDRGEHSDTIAAKTTGHIAKAPRDNSFDEMLRDARAQQQENQRINEDLTSAYVHDVHEEMAADKQKRDREAKDTAEWKRQQAEKIALTEKQAKASESEKTGKIDQQISAVKQAGAEGEISPSQEASQLTSLLDQKLAAQNDYYVSLEKLHEDDQNKWQEIENQRLAAVRKHADEELRVQQNLDKQRERSYLQVVDSIDRAFMNSTNAVLMGQVSIQRGAEQMASRMMLSFVDSMMQQVLAHAAAKEAMLLQDAAHYIAVNVLHIASKTTQATTDAAAAAAKVATTTATNISQVASYAGVAGAAAMASTAAIPIIGPELAPGVAAATLGATLAIGSIASAAGGWGQVPSDTLALIHKNEMVMPASLAEGARRTFANGGSGTSITSHNTFNGVADSTTFKKLIGQHQRDLAKTIQRAARNGRF